MLGTERAALKLFIQGLERTKLKPYGWCVDKLNTKAYETMYDIIVVDGGRGGCAIHKYNKELASVWSDGGGQLPRILRAAHAMGAERLSCYDTGLVQMYAEHGWMVVDRAAFDAQYAPDDWPGDCIPDYVTMVRKV